MKQPRKDTYRPPMIPLPMKITVQQRAALEHCRELTGAPITEHVRRALDEYIARFNKERNDAT